MIQIKYWHIKLQQQLLLLLLLLLMLYFFTKEKKGKYHYARNIK